MVLSIKGDRHWALFMRNKLFMHCLLRYKIDMEIGMEGIQESSELYQGEEIMHQWLILSLSRALWHTVF